ncbi:hypothetical protein CRX69_22000 [Pseudomonas rhizophila]|uniref:Uncharacterized protein n=1 Tax=Pseudomonas rhizophila TaxID=2045200 RepID=A0ABM6UJL6_9PSED|nr:hypothetical protein CRX69_22000 [Pseudomonas rhizophila]
MTNATGAQFNRNGMARMGMRQSVGPELNKSVPSVAVPSVAMPSVAMPRECYLMLPVIPRCWIKFIFSRRIKPFDNPKYQQRNIFEHTFG